MSNFNELPTESQINQQSKNNGDVLVLNIHNKQIDIFNEDTIFEENQTGANLQKDDKYSNNYRDDSQNNNNNIVFFENTRQNPYPFSENRGNKIAETPANKNRFSRSFNPYIIDDFSKKEREKVSEQTVNVLNQNQNQYQLSKDNIITQPKVVFKPKEKQVNYFSFKNITLFIVLTLIFPIAGCLYCFLLCYKNGKNVEEND